VLSIEDIRNFLIQAQETASVYVAVTIFILLVADLFIAMPTLTVTVLSGYFLGFSLGFFTALTGLFTAGVLGYTITYAYGPGLLRKIYKNADQQSEMETIFSRYGVFVLMICRALPILPEVSCCLAGTTRMPFRKFILAFMLGTVPYALIATFAGSKSSLENPKPAIFAAIGLSIVFAGFWMLLRKRYKDEKKRVSP